jgi:hypothetical protein
MATPILSISPAETKPEILMTREEFARVEGASFALSELRKLAIDAEPREFLHSIVTVLDGYLADAVEAISERNHHLLRVDRQD